MKKIYLFVFLALFLPFATAADFVYIIDSSGGIDNDLIEEINILGYSVDTIFEEDLQSTNLFDYRMVIIGNQDLENIDDIDAHKHRTLVINSYNFYNDLGWSSSRGIKSSPTQLELEVNPTSIGDGLPNSFRAYTVSSPNVQSYYLKGRGPSGVNTIISSGLSTDSVVATMDIGNTFNNGNTAEKRNLFFGIVDAGYWTSETKLLFENSITWILYGEDYDGDGFLSDVDCDDSDPLINPDADEIPYDGHDNDCFGGDLLDVDGDGFCAQGFVVDLINQCPYDHVVGTDCNDDDISENPDNPDERLNCINDPPFLETIQLIEANESDLIQLIVIATDPEDNDLTFEINDTRFTVEGNILSWQTDFEDEGFYTFTISVSDFEYTSSMTIDILIYGGNRPPKSIAIPDIEWNEDTTTIINLSEFFYDEDFDSLVFGVQDTSDNVEISIDLIEPGILKFTSIQDWTGEDWIIFFAFDGIDITVSNNITLRVLNINDPPFLENPFPLLNWSEDTSISINLNDYIKDIDSNLTFVAAPRWFNQFSGIADINNNILTMTPSKDWTGSGNVKIQAIDEGGYILEDIAFNVYEAGEPPVFEPIICSTPIDEDEVYICILNATDVEGDELTFSTLSEDNLNCDITNNLVEYSSYKNYHGPASCVLKVSDTHGYDTSTLSVTINPVDDSPSIESKSPNQDSVGILEGETQLFSLIVSDPDSDIIIEWFLNNQSVSNTSSYLFEETSLGNYFLTALISDNIHTIIQEWNVHVGDISEFTCSQVGANTCLPTEYCPHNPLNTLGSGVCCSVTCQALPPSFKDANSCDVLNSSLEIDITDPNRNDKIKIGNDIRTRVQIKNNLDIKQKLNIEIHLYDLDEDKSLEYVEVDLDLKKGERQSISVVLPNSDDIDISNKIAIFAKAEDDICNQDYVEIDLERKEHAIIISNINIPEQAICSETIEAKVRVENIGTSDEDVYLEIFNRNLGIDSKTETFELEKYGDDNRQTLEFLITLPGKTEGDHILNINANYNNGRATQTHDISISCSDDKPSQIITSTTSGGDQDQKLSLQPRQSRQADEDTSFSLTNNPAILVGLFSIISLVLASLAYLLIAFKK
jgi:hypothetical protein